MFFLTLYSGVKGWGASGYIKEKTRNAVENKITKLSQVMAHLHNLT